MKIQKNENKNIKPKFPQTNEENQNPILKPNKFNLNLIWYFLLTSIIVIVVIFIFTKKKFNKIIIPLIYLRNTESNSDDFKVDKSISFDKNGQKLFSQNGKINMNKLYKAYYDINEVDTSNLNNIHITLCFNKEYHLLASVTIASILKNASPKTYIHLHIIALNNLKFKIMNKIYSLKNKINNNTEFIFYDGKRAEEDFELGAKDSERGIIDYARLLIPELVDNVDKVISLDIGDILVLKDLYDLYNTDLGYFAYSAVEDAYPKCFMESIFNHKEKYINGGVILVNIKKWKEIGLYKYVVKMYKYVLTKTKYYTPYADIMNDFLPLLSTGFVPLKYNLPDLIKINEDNQKDYEIWTKNCSYYYNKKDIVIKAEKEVVIRNLYKYKVYKGEGNKDMKKEWKKYAKLTGFYEEICEKYIC